jgi:hypothetical protein
MADDNGLGPEEPVEGEDPPVPEASGKEEGGPSGLPRSARNDGDDPCIRPGRNRQLQVGRTSGRKLFDAERKAVFLEWFAATCNSSWAAEMAGVNYRTVWKHRMNDPAFDEACDRAEEQAVARLRAKQLETKRKPLAIGPEGDWDAPEMDDIDPLLAAQLLREHERGRGGPAAGMGRKQGRRPRIATNAEVRAALIKRLAAYGVRIFEEPPSPEASAVEAARKGGEDDGDGCE